MGLKLRKQLDNGVSVNYHRIVRIQHEVNQETTVFVESYTSQAKRKELLKSETPDVYIFELPISREYDDTLTVPQAYAWLKTLDDFAKAEDVLEEE